MTFIGNKQDISAREILSLHYQLTKKLHKISTELDCHVQLSFSGLYYSNESKLIDYSLDADLNNSIQEYEGGMVYKDIHNNPPLNDIDIIDASNLSDEELDEWIIAKNQALASYYESSNEEHRREMEEKERKEYLRLKEKYG